LPSSESFSASPESDPSVPLEPEVLPAGFGLGSYVIHSCIGRGAMGSVYRAEHTLLKKHVALKIMDPLLLSSGDARQRFLREAQAAAAIKHPNVVAITDTGVIDGMPYLVMELLDGVDLEKHLEQHGPLSEQQLAALTLPVIAALGVAHDTGVVHRDLKPGNIFLAHALDGEIVPKVLDFGVSKFAAFLGQGDLSRTPFGELMGSPLYLPPEAVHGSREATTRSDQYSLAVVLYECVTAQAPFGGDSLLHLLNAIAQGDFDSPRKLRPEISPALERAILRAMSADPGARFEHIRDLGRALLEVADLRTQTLWGPSFGFKRSAALMASSPTASGPLAEPEPSPTPRRVPPWRPLGAFAIVLVAIGLLWVSMKPDVPRSDVTAATPPQTKVDELPGVTTPPAQRPVASAPSSLANAEPSQPKATPPPPREERSGPSKSAAKREAARATSARDVQSEVRALRDSNAASASRRAPRATAAARGGTRKKSDEDLQQMFFPEERGRERPAPVSADDSTPVRNEAPILD
jgi:serine/threonine-protein kinase